MVARTGDLIKHLDKSSLGLRNLELDQIKPKIFENNQRGDGDKERYLPAGNKR
jgi:hypothetical protein